LIYGIVLERNTGELNELREILDNGSFQMAIRNANSADLRKIKDIVDQMQQELQQPEPDIETYFHMDMEFHKAIACSTHNALLIKFNDVLALLVTQIRLKNIKDYIASGHGQFMADLHTRSYQVIKNRDLDGIPSIISDSLKLVNDVIGARNA
jgi:DNA-binding FadR family transcriptional regulator